MAAKNHNGNGTHAFQTFLKGQLEEAQKRLTVFEKDAEKVFKNLVARGKEQRKELESLIQKINNGKDLHVLDNPAVKQFSKRANQASAEVRKRLDLIQTRVVEATGVASQAQVKEINRELSRLSKKLDALVGRKGGGRTEISA